MEYRAKKRYQSEKSATGYDQLRFTGLWGKWAHENEAHALARAIQTHFTMKGTVLDLPCGTGRLLPVLLAQGLRVTGADVSRTMLQVARDRFAENKDVSFAEAEAEKLPFEAGSFDYVTSYRLMCHLPPEVRRRALSEMLRVARRVAIINYHFVSKAPLALWNRLFRKASYPAYPISNQMLIEEARDLKADIVSIRKLSWFERSSALVVFRIRP